MSDSGPGANTNVNVVVQSAGMALGVASTVCGIISIFFMAIIFGTLGLLFGAVGVAKKQYIFSIVGIIASLVGLATSPILWGILGISALVGAAGDAARDDPPRRVVAPAPAEYPAPVPAPEPEITVISVRTDHPAVEHEATESFIVQPVGRVHTCINPGGYAEWNGRYSLITPGFHGQVFTLWAVGPGRQCGDPPE